MADIAALAREWTEAWNRRDWSRYRELMHPEYTYTGPDGQTQKGPEAGLAVGQMFANAFPDGKIDVLGVHASGDVAIVEFIGRGTHKGDLMGIAPTGRQVAIPICEVYEIRDGKIHSERQYMDFMTMMQQLGVAPAQATA
jgi:steroid delta-isomerase-like uncharacterized protein